LRFANGFGRMDEPWRRKLPGRAINFLD